MVTIKLTHEQAMHVYLNADGWIDAGACPGGLEGDERAALIELTEQIRVQVFPTKRKSKPSKQ